MADEERPSRIKEPIATYRVSAPAQAPPTLDTSCLNGVIDAFASVPQEFRGQLSAYFDTSEGRRLLPNFLDKMSTLWSTIESDSNRLLPDVTQAIGLLQEDPTLEVLTAAIQGKRAR